MAEWQWYEEEPQGQFSQAQEYYLEEGLIEVLDTSVQHSVDKALAKALRPISEGPQGAQATTTELPAPVESPEAWPHRALLTQMSANYAEHGYSVPTGKKKVNKMRHRKPANYSDSERSSSEDEGQEKRRQKKRRRSLAEDPQIDGSQFFVPEDIVHPRSSDWTLSPTASEYLQHRLRKSFDNR